jgi:hypothetical protein
MSAVAAETALRSVLVIEGAEELAAIENEVRAFAAPLGYDRFVLFSVSAAQDAVLQSIYRVEDEWFGDGESVDAETYIRRCPVTRHILEAHGPSSGPRRLSYFLVISLASLQAPISVH